jgi:CheY-like chemotaxis protein
VTTQVSACACSIPLEASSGDSILVIDDDGEFRALAARLLESAGFHVSTVAGAAEGLAYMRSHPIDLAILDMVMPDRDGIDALSEIKIRFPAVRVVTVSGAADSDLYLTVSSYLGADASLHKSRVASLCALLNVILDR